MTLLKYFKCTKRFKEEIIQSVSPEPDGPLACPMPCSATETANGATHEILQMLGHSSMIQ